MEEQDLLQLTLPGYILGSSFFHQNLQRGGVCIFVRRDPYFSKINILCNCEEKYLEICAIELGTKSELHTLNVYRVSTGDFNPLDAELNPIYHLLALLGAHPILHVSRVRVNQFITNLDDVLKHLHKPKAELLIFGDINTDYLIETN